MREYSPVRLYLLGWTAGIQSFNGQEFMIETQIKRSPIWGGKAVKFNETKVFKTKAEAIKAISQQSLAHPESKRFVSMATWETWRKENLPPAPENWREKEYLT